MTSRDQKFVARYRGPLLMVGSAIAFALLGVFVKLGAQRIPAHNLVFWRALASAGMSYWVLRRRSRSVWGEQRGLLALRGFLGFCGLMCVFAALARLPLAEATVLQYLHPTLSALMAPLFLRERTDARVWGAVALGFIGVILVSGVVRWGETPLLDAANLSSGVWIGILGAFFSSLAYICVRRLSHREDPLVIVFYFPLVTIPCGLPFVLHEWVWPEGLEWLWVLGIAVCTQMGQVWLTRGFSLMPVSRASVFSYFQVPFAATLGWLIFAAIPGIWTFLGAAAILLGALLAVSARQPVTVATVLPGESTAGASRQNESTRL